MTPAQPTGPGPDRAPTSRRGFLIGAGLAVVGAAGGLGAGLLRHRPSTANVPPPDPDVLLAAVAAERRLIAGLDAALPGGAGTDAALLRLVRADHHAHLVALTASVAVAVDNPSPSLPPVAAPGATPSVHLLRKAESAAATSAAARAAKLTGRDAALLASIAACEATHAELLA